MSPELKGTIRFWDFGGQEIMKCMHRCFLTDRSVCVIVLACREDGMIDRDAIHWIDTINTFSSNVPIILVINKIDLNHTASLREKELRDKYPQIVDIFKTSALTSEGINDLTKCLIKTVSNTDGFKNLHNPKLKELMNSIENNTNSYILRDSFEQLCERIGINEENKLTYLNQLNFLGILHYYKVDSGEERQVYNERYTILKPEWLTNGIYRIINRLPANKGFIKYPELYEIMAKKFTNDVLPEVTYNIDEVEYILYVMRKFNLSYKVDKHEEFIPVSLSKDSPNIVSSFKTKDCIHVSWECNSMIPLNVLYSVMITKYDQLSPKNIWKYGAVFNTSDGKSSALIEFDVNEKSISIYVKSSCGEAKEYFSEIRRAINNALKEIKEVSEYLYHWFNNENKEVKFRYKAIEAYLQETNNLDYKVFDETLNFREKIKNLLKIIYTDNNINTIINNFNMEKQFIVGGRSPIFDGNQGNVYVTYNEQSCSKLPEELSQEKWQQFVEFMERFLESEEADELRGKDRKKLEGGKSWSQMREILADAANATTLFLPLQAFVANHGGQIVQWIKSLFG